MKTAGVLRQGSPPGDRHGEEERVQPLVVKAFPEVVRKSPLAWLRDIPESPSASNMAAIIERLAHVRAIGIDPVIAETIHERRFDQYAYMQRAVEHLRARDVAAPDELLAHLSPMSWAHVGLTGDYLWANAASAGGFRPLNDPADRLYRAA